MTVHAGKGNQGKPATLAHLRNGVDSGKLSGSLSVAPAATKQAPPYVSDDEDYTDSDYEGDDGYKPGGYHPVRIGDVFKSGRYLVLRKLGWGHFSTVWLVHDRCNNSLAALKVQKSATHYTEAARDEIKLLSEIRDGDPDDACACCRLLDHFEHRGPHGRHVCMLFEVLGENLLALVKRYDYQGVPMPVVRNLASQILVGLDYLHSKLEIIHTDLKPENVMLTQPINPREWRLPASEVSSGPATAGGKPLTKNQKKKMKKKAKKAEARGDSDSAAAGACQQADAPITSGADASASEELSRATESLTAGFESGAEDTGGDAQSGPLPANADATADGEGRVCRAAVLTDETLVSAGCKIVDFGNACWRSRHFTDDIQTRQYRSPEVILGQGYDTSTDMWSLACMLFELATGDLLFDPREAKDRSYSRDEDHLALMMELIGPMPISMTIKGVHTPKYFQREGGHLRHIKDLKFWPLTSVLVEKYSMPPEEAQGLSDFLMPMLRFAPESRATAAVMLQHPWLHGHLPEAPAELRQLYDGKRKHECTHSPDVDALQPSAEPPASQSPDAVVVAAKRCRCRSAPSQLCGGDDTAKFARLNGYDEQVCIDLMRYAITLDDLLASAPPPANELVSDASLTDVNGSGAPGFEPVPRLDESAWSLVNSGVALDAAEHMPKDSAAAQGASCADAADVHLPEALPRTSSTGVRENTPRAANLTGDAPSDTSTQDKSGTPRSGGSQEMSSLLAQEPGDCGHGGQRQTAQPSDQLAKGVSESIVVVPANVRMSDSCGSETLASAREDVWTLL